MVSPYTQDWRSYSTSSTTRRKRAAELGAGLGDGLNSIAGGADALARVKRALKGDTEADEDRAQKLSEHTEDRKLSVDEKIRKLADSRSDQAWEEEGRTWKREDRAKALAKEPEDAEIESAANTHRLEGAFDKVRKSLAEDEAKETKAAEKQTKADKALALREREFAAKHPDMVSDEELAKHGLRRKPKGKGGPSYKEREADARIKKLEAETAKMQKPDGGKPLQSGEAGTIAELDGLLASIDSVEAKKQGVDTGPAIGRWMSLRAKFGADDPRVAKLRAEVGSQVADYIKSISGATVNEAERAQLLENIPTMNDNDASFTQKLNGLRERVRRMRDIKVRTMGASGRDVRGVQKPNLGEPPDDLLEALAGQGLDDDEIKDELRKRGYDA